MAFLKIKSCLACNSKNLVTVLDLKKQPLANSFIKNKKKKEKKYELKVKACKHCTHLQLSIAVNPKIIYKNYDYLSGTTKTYKDYMNYFYKFSIKNLDHTYNRNVLDVGCNDGSQLDVFKKNNFKTIGVDPAKNIYPISSKKHKVYCEFFNSNVVKLIKQKFDLIIFQNSFAHNPNPKKLLMNIKKLMHERSTLIIQTSQADMCKNKEFDTVYHEHINFFNIKSMKSLLNRVGFKLDNVKKNKIHGTSYLFVIKFNSNENKIKNLMNKERYLNFNFYKRWGVACSRVVRNIKKTIENIQSKNIVIGYGAAAKANTFLNFSKIKLNMIIDDNVFKQNKYSPGMKIPIKSIENLKKFNKDIYILPLAWNFFDEIKNKIKKIRPKNKDNFIACFPKFQIYK